MKENNRREECEHTCRLMIEDHVHDRIVESVWTKNCLENDYLRLDHLRKFQLRNSDELLLIVEWEIVAVMQNNRYPMDVIESQIVRRIVDFD